MSFSGLATHVLMSLLLHSAARVTSLIFRVLEQAAAVFAQVMFLEVVGWEGAFSLHIGSFPGLFSSAGHWSQSHKRPGSALTHLCFMRNNVVTVTLPSSY